ncbi:hypothetical protein [Acinetobacter sp. Ac_5812]|uniref:hypothetical protein n=1 Tax=Acinetobacter sp. Ac_5812 TaxID=1848937 RepID=UPI00149045D6|nr:hypothetical protein [Acinetobacter sp. Ac_5812]NNP69888.1 hypothetical protein [Acinetobacter sp. Ac_5812]
MLDYRVVLIKGTTNAKIDKVVMESFPELLDKVTILKSTISRSLCLTLREKNSFEMIEAQNIIERFIVFLYLEGVIQTD